MRQSKIDVILTGLTTILIAVCITSAINQLNPFEFSFRTYAAIGISTIAACFISYVTGKLSGVLTGILYITSLTAFSSTVQPQTLFVVIVAFFSGILFHRHSIVIMMTSIVLLVVAWLLWGIGSSAIFLVSASLTFVLQDYSRTVARWLSAPLSQLSNFTKALSGFGIAYLLSALFFALLYQLTYQFNRDGAFEFNHSWGNPIPFYAFFYLSIIALRSNPPPGITPLDIVSKSIFILESITGIFLLVVFIKFALSDTKDSTK
jgi:MFS family permease